MGVKWRPTLAVIFIIIFICTVSLYGGFQYQLDYCLKPYTHNDQSLNLHRSNSSGKNISQKWTHLEVCPGQKFQVAYLLMHLQSAPASADDILLKPYLASWDELIKFMETLGPMVGLISQEIQSKTSIIRKLARQEDLHRQQKASEEHQASAYVSVRSMIVAELQRGLVDFDQTTESGCRTLLRLHRALLWLELFLSNLADEREEAMARSPTELCREAYRTTLAQHHSWWVRHAAELAFVSFPERSFFYRLMCVETQAGAAAVLHAVVEAIQEVYNRTQAALEEHDMLALP